MRTYWLIPVFALLLLGAGCALSKSQTNQDAKETAHDLVTDSLEPEAVPSTAAVATTMALPLDATPADASHIVPLDAGEFFFKPDSIHAKAGETMVLQFGAVTGEHIFTIDELHISEKMTPGGTLTFTVPSTAGRYIYYCSVGPHKTLGMTGTLIVE